MVGAGLFVVTGLAARAAGPAILLSFLIASCLAAANALSSARLAARYPVSGGSYEYGYQLISPLAGFAAGWLFLVSKLSAAATVALGFAHYVVEELPSLSARPVALFVVLLLTALNLLEVRKTGRLNTIIVLVTVTSLLYLVAGAAFEFDGEHLTPFAPHGTAGVLEGAALIFFAFTGYARLATLGEEVLEPERTIPKAIVLSVALTSLLYLAVTLAALGAVGAPVLAGAQAPLTAVAEASNLPLQTAVLTIGGATAMLGVLLSQILGLSRMVLAMTRRGDLPALPGGAARLKHSSVILCGVIISLLVITGSLSFVTAQASCSILLYYAVANIAAMRLTPDERKMSRFVPVFGLCGCIVLVFAIEPYTIAATATLLACGLAVRLLSRRARLLRK